MFYAPRPSGCSTIPRHAASSRRSPITGSTFARSTTPSPSTTLYNDYELDDPLKLAALEETLLFFAELLRADLPARNVVDSDFTFLNERLAEHYGIGGVSGVRIPQGEAAS